MNVAQILKNVSVNLKRLRARSEPRLTQQNLAHKSKLSYVTIASIERCKYSSIQLYTLVSIASALKCSIEDLIQDPEI